MPRKAIDYKDKSIDVDWRIDRCSHNLKHHENKMNEFKEILKDLAQEKFEQGLGIEIGQTYEFRYRGQVYRGQVLGININKKKEYSLKVDVELGKKTVIWYIAPEQIIGYEAIPQERLKTLFQVLQRATQ